MVLFAPFLFAEVVGCGWLGLFACGLHSFVVCLAFACGVAAADGAAAVLAAGAAVDHGAPDVAVFTAPPHFFAAAGQHLVGGEGAV